MEAGKTRAFVAQCKSLRDQASIVIKDLNTLDHSYVELTGAYYSSAKLEKVSEYILDSNSQARALIKSVENVRATAKELGLTLPEIDIRGEPRAALRQIIVMLDSAIGFVGEAKSNLSAEEKDTLGYLRKETIEVCRNLDINFEKNLTLAIESAEAGDFLGSALITSRIIAFVLDRIDGKEINDKIATLIAIGAMKEDRDDVNQSILKANKKVRNFLTHRIDTLADASDALSLLGDCIKILKLYTKTAK